MIKGEHVIDYDDDDLDPNRGQCCLRAAHLSASFSLLAILSAVICILSFHDEYFINLRTPAAAILGLTSFLAVITGCISIFVECRLQEKSNICRRLYLIVCCMCIDEIDKKVLYERSQVRDETQTVSQLNKRSDRES